MLLGRAISVWIALCTFFFFNDTATTEIYTLSLHDALPISRRAAGARGLRHRPPGARQGADRRGTRRRARAHPALHGHPLRSEEHTSELQSRQYLVCRLLLEKKTQNNTLLKVYFILQRTTTH